MSDRRQRVAALMVGLVTLFCVLAPGQVAQAQETGVTLVVGQGSGNIGDTAEVAVQIQGGTNSPASLVVVLAYDPAKLAPFEDYYEFVETDVLGNPITNGSGNAITRTSAVKPGQSAIDVDRLFQAEVHPEGVIVVALWGDNRAVADGLLMTVAFQILLDATENEAIPVEGVASDEEVLVLVEETSELEGVWSSAALGDSAVAVPVDFQDGVVQVGCTPPDDVPLNVLASQDRSDAVRVSWDSVSTPGAEYRVYRSNDTDRNNALPLGDEWSTATFYIDVSAQAPIEVVASGCFSEATFAAVHHYYWVKARTPGIGCEGLFSAPAAEGFRSTAKSFAADGGFASAAKPRDLDRAAVLGVLGLALLFTSRRRRGD